MKTAPGGVVSIAREVSSRRRSAVEKVSGTSMTWARPCSSRSLACGSGWPGIRAAVRVPYSCGHNVATREEVDVVMEQAMRAGARIVKPAQETFYGGYAGYFQDPDGHLWEVAFNPGFASLG